MGSFGEKNPSGTPDVSGAASGEHHPRSSGRDRGPMLLFGLKFGALMASYYAVILLPSFDRLLYVYLRANAWASNAVINLLGQSSHVFGVTIRSSGFAIGVRRGCDAVEPAWFFCAAVFSFPAALSRKIPGILAGAAAILVLNLARIVSLFFIGLHCRGLFSIMHLEIWPAAFIVVAVLLWMGWIRWARRTARSELHATK